MEASTAHTRMNELSARIAAGLIGLEKGDLDLEALDALCDDLRELNERMIVLRHAARVEHVRGESGLDAAAEVEGQPIEVPTPDPRQITLIEAIESEKKAKKERREQRVTATIIASEPAPNPIPAPAPAQQPLFKLMPPSPSPAPAKKASLAQKLEHAPIADLQKVIVLSQKFWFINELFSKDASAYERTIKQLNTASGLEEARAIMRTEVEERSKKKLNEEAMAQLAELIERRFGK